MVTIVENKCQVEFTPSRFRNPVKQRTKHFDTAPEGTNYDNLNDTDYWIHSVTNHYTFSGTT